MDDSEQMPTQLVLDWSIRNLKVHLLWVLGRGREVMQPTRKRD